MKIIEKLIGALKKPSDTHQNEGNNTGAASSEPEKKEIRKEPLTPSNSTVTYSNASIIFRER